MLSNIPNIERKLLFEFFVEYLICAGAWRHEVVGPDGRLGWLRYMVHSAVSGLFLTSRSGAAGAAHLPSQWRGGGVR